MSCVCGKKTTFEVSYIARLRRGPDNAGDETTFYIFFLKCHFRRFETKPRLAVVSKVELYLLKKKNKKKKKKKLEE